MKYKFEPWRSYDDDARTPMMRSLENALHDRNRTQTNMDFFHDKCELAGEGESPLKFLLNKVDRQLDEHNKKLETLRVERDEIVDTIGLEFADDISQTINEEEAEIGELRLIQAKAEDVKQMIDDIVRMLRLKPVFHYKPESIYDCFETIYSIDGIKSDIAVTISLSMDVERGVDGSRNDVRTELIIGSICTNRRSAGDVVCAPLVGFSRGWSREPSSSHNTPLGYRIESISQYDWAIMKWIKKTVCDFSDYPDLGFMEDTEVNENETE